MEAIEEHLNRIDVALGLKPIEPPNAVIQAWEAFRGWLTLHKTGIRWAIGIVVTIAGWFLAANYKVYVEHKNDALNAAIDSRVSGILSKPGGLEETLGKVSKTADRTDETLSTLTPFINDVVTHQFENASKLSAQALSQRLPAVNALLAVAKDQDLILDRQAAGIVGSNLTHVDREARAYWPVAGRLISTTLSETNLSNSDDINCFSETHPVQGGGVEPILATNPVWTDCTLHLDDLRGFENSYEYQRLFANLLARGHPFELSLLRVKIVYAGGQLIPFARLTAVNCTFAFSLPSVPPLKGQALVEALLTDFTKANLTISLPAEPATHS